MERLARIFACFLLVVVSGCSGRMALDREPRAVLLVSVDGLRADVVGSGAMPTLDALAASGVRAQWMTPSYPSLTFPNHYTLVTGLRPDHHGIVNNTMRDPVLGDFSLGDRDAVEDPRWWGGEPAWVTVQRQGGHAATMFWPGSEAPIAGAHPDYWLPFDGDMSPAARVDQVLEWLDLPVAKRPRLLTLYFDQVDHAEHDDGPDSPGARAAQALVDAALSRLLAGLEARGMRDSTDLVVVSDHGMAAVAPGQVEYLDDYLATRGLPISAIEVVSRGSAVGVAPAKGIDVAAVEAALVGRHPHGECWRKAELPPRWHYGAHPRVPAIVCQADSGWQLTVRASARRRAHTGGAHGFDPQSEQMRAVFVADGPSFADGATLPPFDNVDVYPLLMRLLGVPAKPNDGDPATFDAVLR